MQGHTCLDEIRKVLIQHRNFIVLQGHELDTEQVARIHRMEKCRSHKPTKNWIAVACAGMQPAVQYLAGELKIEAGQVLPVLATHNTVRLRFDIEEAEYLHLAKPDAAFSPSHFSMLADTRRNQATHLFCVAT